MSNGIPPVLPPRTQLLALSGATITANGSDEAVVTVPFGVSHIQVELLGTGWGVSGSASIDIFLADDGVSFRRIGGITATNSSLRPTGCACGTHLPGPNDNSSLKFRAVLTNNMSLPIPLAGAITTA